MAEDSAEAANADLMPWIKKLHESNPRVSSRVVEICVKEGKHELAVGVLDAAREQLGEEAAKEFQFGRFVSGVCDRQVCACVRACVRA